MADTTADSRRTPNSGAMVQASAWVGLLGGLLVIVVQIFSISHTAIHNPEDITTPTNLIVHGFDQFVRDPVAAVIRYVGRSYESATSVHLVKLAQRVGISDLLASAAIFLVGLFLVYASILALFRVYDEVSAVKTVKGIGIFVLTLFSLPLGVLAIIHVFQVWFHIRLLPLAQGALDDYRQIVHSMVDGLYWLPLYFFSWKMPIWFKDLAAISIVSVGMNRKAWMPQDLNHFGLDWDEFWPWLKDGFSDVGEYDIFDWIELVPETASMIVAWLVGWGVKLVMFWRWTGWTWLPERVAATTYVISRGVMFLGFLYPIGYLWGYPRSLSNKSRKAIRYRQAARRYAVYLTLTGGLVAWFFWTWHVGAPFVNTPSAGH